MAKKPGRRRKSGTSPADLLEQIQSGDIRSLYLLYGTDDLERDALLEQLTSAVVDPVTRTFNLDVLRADDLDVSDAVGRATAFPMVAPRRMVVLKDAEKLQEAATQELLSLVQDPPDTTVLVFTATKIDARKKFFAELKKAAVCVEFREPYDREVPEWIQRRVAATGRQIQPEAVHLLHVSVGPRPRDLANELEKLAIHIGERNLIEPDDVSHVVGISRGTTVFELGDAVGQGDADRAQSILKRLLEQGESPVGVVSLLARHIGIVRKAKWLLGARLPRQEMAGKLKVPPFYLKGYLDQADRFSEDDLRTAYRALLDADDRLKSAAKSPATVLSLLVHLLSRRKADAAGAGA